MTADVIVSNEGTVWAFDFLTNATTGWLAENVETEDWQWLGGRLVVDHRCGAMLVEALEDAGFDVECR